MPQLSDGKWILQLAFLADVTTYLNELDVIRQGKGKFFLQVF